MYFTKFSNSLQQHVRLRSCSQIVGTTLCYPQPIRYCSTAAVAEASVEPAPKRERIMWTLNPQQAPLPLPNQVTAEKAAKLEKARNAAKLIYFTRYLSKNKTGIHDLKANEP